MRSLSLCSTRLMLLRSKFRILKFEVQSPMSEVGGRGKSHADDPLPSFRSPIAASQILWGSEIRCHEERNTRSLSFYTHTHFCVCAALFCRVQRGPIFRPNVGVVGACCRQNSSAKKKRKSRSEGLWVWWPNSMADGGRKFVVVVVVAVASLLSQQVREA